MREEPAMSSAGTEPPYLVIPGWEGSGPLHWQSQWQAALGAERVELADWTDPTPVVWQAGLLAAQERLWNARPEPAVVLAHSLGCVVFAASLLAARRPVRAALLVAPADVEAPHLRELLGAFAPVCARPLPFASLVVTSDDDPYVELARARQFARVWGSELEVVPGGGHLNTAAGFGPWPQGRAMLSHLVARSGHR